MNAVVNDDQYMTHVTDLGESEVVTASEDIVSEKGVMLLPKGAAINKKMLSKLQQHSLDQQVDQVITIEDALDSAQIMEIGQLLLKEHPEFAASQAFLFDRTMPIRSFGRLRLNTTTRNKLTVCKNQKPELFEHSMLVAYCCMCVADLMKVPLIEADELITAAMLHDLGMMHLSKEFHDHSEIYTPEQERQIASHPIIMYQILAKFPEYTTIANLILEHHEHLDGSGYPKALVGKTSLPSQILSATECAISVFQKHGYNYTLSVLKTHMAEQFNDKVSKCLIRILNSWHEASSEFDFPRNYEDVEALYEKLNTSVTSGAKILSTLTNPFASSSAVIHLKQRISAIEVALANVGLDKLRGATTLKMTSDDDDLIIEIGDVIQDSIFQVFDSIRIFRRQLHPESKVPPELTAWLKQTEDTLKDCFLGE